MHFTKPTLFGLLPAVMAKNYQIIVGQNNQLTFTPNTVSPAVGDTVQFMYANANHTATAGNPNQGCTPSGQFNSGFVPSLQVAAAAAAKAKKAKNQRRGTNAYWTRQAGQLPSFTVPIQNTNPVTVYCAAANHCQLGMVMTINPPQTGPQTLAAWKATCAKATTNTAAQNVNGGTLVKNPGAATNAGAGTGTGTGTGAGAATSGTGKGKKGKGKKGKKAAKCAGTVTGGN